MMENSIEIVSYNIGSVLSELRRSNVIRHISQSSEILKTDIVCLQEAYFSWMESGSIKNEIVVKNYPYSVFGENAQFIRGRMGNLTMSKYPIVGSQNFDLSVVGREARGCLATELRLPDDSLLTVLNIHLGLRSWEREYQFKFLFDYIQTIPDEQSLILAGDFNDWKGTIHSLILKDEIIRDAAEESTGKLARTFHSIFPIFPLDRIYYKNLQLNSFVRYQKTWRGVSDHLPIAASFSVV